MSRPKNKDKIANKLKNKSIEAYLLCLEIYNKPTIQYRIEASSYFICNAWELLLKAHYISLYGEKSVLRPNSPLSYSLQEMLSKCFEDNDPIKKNLLYIIEKIRNKSTHFIIPEHDYIYTPFLQKAVLNYSKYLYDKFAISVADKIPFEYLALISRKELQPKTISKLYSKNYSNLFTDDLREVNETMQNTLTVEDSIFAQITYNVYFTRNPNTADIRAYYQKGDEAIPFKEIMVPKDANKSHPYSMKQVIKRIKQIAEDNNLNYHLEKLNQSRLSTFNKEHNISKHPEYYFEFTYSSLKNKTYSEAYVQFVLKEIRKHPDLFAE